MNKYKLLFDFLKKKVGPDPSRMIIYNVLCHDIKKYSKNSKPKKQQNFSWAPKQQYIDHMLNRESYIKFIATKIEKQQNFSWAPKQQLLKKYGFCCDSDICCPICSNLNKDIRCAHCKVKLTCESFKNEKFIINYLHNTCEKIYLCQECKEPYYQILYRE
jgi:hypothetical protein